MQHVTSRILKGSANLSEILGQVKNMEDNIPNIALMLSTLYSPYPKLNLFTSIIL